MSLKELLLKRRKHFEKTVESDGSDVSSSSSGSSADDSEDEIKNYKKGGYCKVQIGDKFFSKYEVVSKLGRGHFSTVWKCINPKTNEEVAMKIQKARKSYRLAAMEEIVFHDFLNKQESENKQYVNLLIYANTYKGPFGNHSCIFLPVMQQDLLTYQESQETSILTLGQTSVIAQQFLKGLDFLHTNDVIHTDIKPDNILISVVNEKEFCQIADLGTACVDGDRSNDYIQTTHYRSPEIIMQYKQWDTKIDIWSSACLIFEMLTGQYLFDGDGEGDMILSMVETLGMPPKDFLYSCKSKHEYFNRDDKLRFRNDLSPMPLDRLLEEEYNFSNSDSLAICRLLKPMLHFHPKCRASAGDVLKLYP